MRKIGFVELCFNSKWGAQKLYYLGKSLSYSDPLISSTVKSEINQH